MLTESFIAATLHPPKNAAAASTSTNASLRDASIFHHNIHPQSSLRCTLKKSATNPNCLAVNASHIFAPQKDKAVVQVYSFDRDGSSQQENPSKKNAGGFHNGLDTASNASSVASSGKHESTFPFSERITSCTLIPGGGGSRRGPAPTADQSTDLALGTESGRLILWSLVTGETITTAPSHLKPVTSLVADCSGDFVLSGAADSTVHVWSVVETLANDTPSNPLQDSGAPVPRTSFTAHRAPVTSITTGHIYTPHNIAVSASKDATVHLWAYRTATLLRTFLLPSTPLCLTLDPADRAVFAGCSDGGVTCLELYDPETYQSRLQTLSNQTDASAPVQAPPSSHWPLPNAVPANPEASTHKSNSNSTSSSADENEPYAVLSVALSHSGTTLLTGHAHGSISTWDVGAHPSHYTGTVSSHPHSPSSAAVTNLHFLPLMPPPPKIKLPTQLPKPFPMSSRHTAGERGNAGDLGAATITLLGGLGGAEEGVRDVTTAMTGPGVPQSLLMDDAALLDDLEWQEGGIDEDEALHSQQPATNGSDKPMGLSTSSVLSKPHGPTYIDKRTKHDSS